MRYSRRAPEADKLVIWSDVVGVRYEYTEKRRLIILTYEDGSELYLERQQAYNVWVEHEDHSDCPAPCYYRFESDKPPRSCMECQLSECLLGLRVATRPEPLPPIITRKQLWDWRLTLIVFLIALLYMQLIIMSDRWGASPPPPEKYQTRARVTPARAVTREGRGSKGD